MKVQTNQQATSIRNQNGKGKGHRKATSNAWRGKQSQRRVLAEWLWSTHLRCPIWREQWEVAQIGLTTRGYAKYRGVIITQEKLCQIIDENTQREDKITPIFTKTITKPDLMLFSAAHHDLILLILCLRQDVSEEERRSVVGVLLSQWPYDQAWEKAVRHRAGMIKAAESRAAQTRGVVRIISEKKSSLVLVKNSDGIWVTRNGNSIRRVLGSSGHSRKKAISILTKLPGLEFIELPRQMKFSVLAEHAKLIREVLSSEHDQIQEAKLQKRTWRFAIRRVQQVGLKGCFDPATQTVIVDPRHMDTALHELCHWLLDHAPQVSGTRLTKDRENQVEELMRVLLV